MSTRTRNLIVYFNTSLAHLGGVQSQIHWHSPDFLKALRQMFHAKDDEVITAIAVREEGITATFERR